MAIMQQAQEARFIDKMSKQLSQKCPDFDAGKAPEFIQNFIAEILELCRKYRITTGVNIQQIITVLAEHQVSLPLPETLLNLLKKKNQTESRRTENLLLSVASGSYKLQPIALNLS